MGEDKELEECLGRMRDVSIGSKEVSGEDNGGAREEKEKTPPETSMKFAAYKRRSSKKTEGGGLTGAQALESQKVSDEESLKEYQELLDRLYEVMKVNSPTQEMERKRHTIPPPVVQRDGNKKTVFANITDICARINRPPEHMIQYMFVELGTTGSTDSNQRLIIKGRFQQKQIENVIRKYITEYVTCKTCRSPYTILSKENRLSFQTCSVCGSTRTVTTIKAGFKAQTERRSILRNKI